VILSIIHVVHVVLIVLVIGIVVNIRELLLVGVPGTLVIGKDSKLNTITVRGAHGTNVKVKVVPLNASLNTLAKVGNPFRHILIKLLLVLLLLGCVIGVFVFLGIFSVTCVTGALVAVNVFSIVGELTFDGLG